MNSRVFKLDSQYQFVGVLDFVGAHNISNLFIYYTINLMFSICLSPSVKIERGFL